MSWEWSAAPSTATSQLVRDELLTQLIIESYDRLGAVVEAADASVATATRARWEATAQAMRSWAVAFPSEWALLFGTPVPGYRAPQDTIGPATRYTTVLMGLLVNLEAAGAHYEQAVPAAMAADLEVLRTNFSIDCSVGALAAGVRSLGSPDGCHLAGAVRPPAQGGGHARGAVRCRHRLPRRLADGGRPRCPPGAGGNRHPPAHVETAMNRRSFLTVLGAPFLAPVAASLLAACGDDETEAGITHPMGPNDVVVKVTSEGGFVPEGFMFINHADGADQR